VLEGTVNGAKAQGQPRSNWIDDIRGLMWRNTVSLSNVQKTGTAVGTWHIYFLHKKK